MQQARRYPGRAARYALLVVKVKRHGAHCRTTTTTTTTSVFFTVAVRATVDAAVVDFEILCEAVHEVPSRRDAGEARAHDGYAADALGRSFQFILVITGRGSGAGGRGGGEEDTTRPC